MLEFNEEIEQKVLQGKYYWGDLSCYYALSEDIIEKYKDKLDWYWIVSKQEISEEFIKKHIRYVGYPNLLYSGRLEECSEAFQYSALIELLDYLTEDKEYLLTSYMFEEYDKLRIMI